MIYVHFVAPDQSLFYKRYIYNVIVSLYIISRCRDPEMLVIALGTSERAILYSTVTFIHSVSYRLVKAKTWWC